MALIIRRLAARDPLFEHCFEIRLEVFVREQNVPPDEERDAYDEIALHFLCAAEDKALGTARVLMKDTGIAKISRVAVRKTARGQGIGAALIKAVEEELPLARCFALDAQVHALSFYEQLGYTAQGEVFMEAGIAHRRMLKRAAGMLAIRL